MTVINQPNGPLWPLGNIVVGTPGTPVGLMSLVDSANTNAPETASSYASPGAEYTRTCYQIQFQGYKAGSGPPRFVVNTGLVYVVLKPTSGATDTGNVVGIIPAGGSFTLTAAALNRDVINPYEIFLDADTADDAAQVTLFIQ